MKKLLIVLLFLSAQVAAKEVPPLPWAQAAEELLPPAEPGADYTPIVVPNGVKAPYKVVDGVKVFHLIAEEIEWEVAPGLTIHAWGYNGTIPGPLIEVGVGDRLRIYVTNHLPAPTSVHWHGILIPCGMDGVAGITQPPIPVGETFLYEFFVPESGTFMYHPHFDDMTQEGMGLIGMLIVHQREPDPAKRATRDFAILLHEWAIQVGTARPNTIVMDFNIFTMNGKVMPATEPLVAQIGDTVWVRYGNLSAIDHHPIHLHGYKFKVIGGDGGWAPDKSLLLPETTVLVPVGSTKVIEFLADNPGDWIFHCHMTHHTMNQMGHDFPNMVGVVVGDLDKKVEKLIPGYKTMGTTGMEGMHHGGSMTIPKNSIPMLGYHGQFGKTIFGGMANVLRVREHLDGYADPGPYSFPKGTVAAPPTEKELERDGVILHVKQNPDCRP